MNARRIKELSKKPDLISGIFNYCDRWCERCTFTQRCLTFSISREAYPDDESRDLNNAAYWKSLENIFAATRELIEETAREQGLDLSVEIDPTYEQSVKANHEEAKRHPCARAAWTYIETANRWFEENKESFEDKGREWDVAQSCAIPAINPEQEYAAVDDAIEIIRWYQHQIYVKLLRALHREPGEEPELDEVYKQDADGSVKVALIGIDRSISAWSSLRRHFPDCGDSIISILLHLERLRRAFEKLFPEARAFVRPGFDTP